MRARADPSHPAATSPGARRLLPPRGEGGAGHHDDLQPLALLQQVIQPEPAFALGRAQVSCGQDAAEPAISRAILRIGEQVRRAVVEGEPCAGNDPHALHRRRVLAREHMRAHDAGQRIAIRDPNSRKPKLGRARDHLLGMRGPAQKRKICHRRQFGEPRLKADHSLLPLAGKAAQGRIGQRAPHHRRPHGAAIVGQYAFACGNFVAYKFLLRHTFIQP